MADEAQWASLRLHPLWPPIGFIFCAPFYQFVQIKTAKQKILSAEKMIFMMMTSNKSSENWYQILADVLGCRRDKFECMYSPKMYKENHLGISLSLMK